MNAEQPGAIYQPSINGITVVEMYFNTCVYCNQNAERVNKLAEFYEPVRRVQVLDVGIDKNDSDYSSWIAKHQPNHPVLKDAQRNVAKALGTTSYPSTYVLDCNGEVLYKSVGAWTKKIEDKVYDAIDRGFGIQCDSKD